MNISNLTSLLLTNSLASSSSRFATATNRIGSGTQLLSSADNPAGVVKSNTFRSEISQLNAQMSAASNLNSMIAVADDAVATQITKLQDMRSLAVSAASSTTSSSERSSLQSQLDSYVSDIDLYATTTKFGTRNLLDGSAQTSYSLGASGSNVSVDFQSTKSSAIGTVATVTGSTITSTALASGDIVLNGITVGAASASDDTVSTSGNDASAISTAAAINLTTADHGVTASVNDTTVNLGTVSAGSFSAGDLLINGVDIGAVTVSSGDSDSALQTAINAVSSTTGVSASLNGSNELVLTANDGRNIQTSGNSTNGGGVVSSDPGTAVVRGSITLTSSSAITISGADTASAGLSAGTTAVDTTSTINSLDITTEAGAEAAVQQIDSAIESLTALRADLGATSTQLDSLSSSFETSSGILSTAQGAITDVDVASETANQVSASLMMQSQIALLSQSQNIDAQNVGMLLSGLISSGRSSTFLGLF